MPVIDVPAVVKKDLHKRFRECAFVSYQGDALMPLRHITLREVGLKYYLML
jgi:hypothetical protein